MTCKNNGLKWIHHVERTENERIRKQLMDHTPRGTRTFGRLMLGWKDYPILQGNTMDPKLRTLMMLMMMMMMMMMNLYMMFLS
jgi:hypothetical protein